MESKQVEQHLGAADLSGLLEHDLLARRSVHVSMISRRYSARAVFHRPGSVGKSDSQLDRALEVLKRGTIFERQEQGPAASDRAALSGRLTVVGLDATHLNLPRDVGVACLGLLLLLHTERLGRINATIRTRVGQRVPFLSI